MTTRINHISNQLAVFLLAISLLGMTATGAHAAPLGLTKRESGHHVRSYLAEL